MGEGHRRHGHLAERAMEPVAERREKDEEHDDAGKEANHIERGEEPGRQADIVGRQRLDRSGARGADTSQRHEAREATSSRNGRAKATPSNGTSG